MYATRKWKERTRPQGIGCLTLIAACSSLSLASAQECEPEILYVSPRGGFEWPLGVPGDVAVEGSTAFVLMQTYVECAPPTSGSTLVTVDVREPSRPTPLGLVRAPGLRISVSGDVACLAGRGEDGLSVIDVSDPARPIFSGTLEMPSGAKRVHVAGDLAYVADGEAGIQIVDVADPATPGIISSIVLPGLVGAANPINHRSFTDFFQSGGMHLIGDRLYVVDGAGLRVIDVSNPLQPGFLGALETPGEARGVHVEGDVAYVFDLDSEAGLHAVDIADPGSMAIVGSLARELFALVEMNVWNGIGYATSPSVENGTGFCRSGFAILDLTDSRRTEFLRRDTSFGLGEVYHFHEFAFAADRAYAIGRPGLTILELEDPLAPTLLGSVPLLSEGTRHVVVEGDLAYLVRSHTIEIWDVETPATPSFVSSIMALPRPIAVDDGIAVAAAGGALRVFDFKDPAQPILRSQLEVRLPTPLGPDTDPRFTGTPALLDDVAYIASRELGLVLFDVSDPGSPEFLSWTGLEEASCMAVSGDLAYVAVRHRAGFPSGVAVIDVGNPRAPSELGWVDVSSDSSAEIWHVAVSGDLVFATSRHGRDKFSLHMIDVGDPGRPVIVGELQIEDRVEHLAVSGSLVFLHLRDELLLLDASDPAAPELRSRALSPGPGNVWAEGTRAYVGSGGDFRILDFSSCVSARARFRRGECDGDGGIALPDAVCSLEWLFAGTDRAPCLAALDTNGDRRLDVSDPVWLLNFLFAGGPPPPEPFGECGLGTDADKALGCETSNCP